MGLTIALCVIANESCCRDNPNYYIKQDSQKDELTIYQLSPEYQRYEFCPICSEYLSDNINKEINHIIDSYGPNAINELKTQYDYLVGNPAIIDVFPQLEKTINQIEEIKKNYEEKKYYKYKCEKNNKECYINLFRYSVEELDKLKDFTYKDKRYDISKWQNDENLKKILLEERTKQNKIFLIREYNKKVLIEYNQKKEILEQEWEKITFQKEYNIYKQKCQYFHDFSINNVPRNTAAGLMNTTNISGVKYLSTKRRIIEYISKYAKNEIERQSYLTLTGSHRMSANEEREFQNFLKSRLAPPQLLKIDQEHMNQLNLI